MTPSLLDLGFCGVLVEPGKTIFVLTAFSGLPKSSAGTANMPFLGSESSGLRSSLATDLKTGSASIGELLRRSSSLCLLFIVLPSDLVLSPSSKLTRGQEDDNSTNLVSFLIPVNYG